MKATRARLGYFVKELSEGWQFALACRRVASRCRTLYALFLIAQAFYKIILIILFFPYFSRSYACSALGVGSRRRRRLKA
jgi:hypothetical protein